MSSAEQPDSTATDPADATDATETAESTGAEANLVLPEPVRRRVVDYCADALGAVPARLVPAPLRRIARFTPTRRAKHGAEAIAAQVAADDAFRERIAEVVAGRFDDLVAAMIDGAVPAAADPVQVAALAYLIRGTGWREQVAVAAGLIEAETSREVEVAASAEAERLAAELATVRRRHQQDMDRVRRRLAQARTEADRANSRIRDLAKSVRELTAESERANELLGIERGRARADGTALAAENRRLKAELDQLKAAASVARQAAKEGRSADEARLWLLVETVSNAAAGLRRELALSPPETLPADGVTAGRQLSDVTPAADGPARAPARGLATDDPAWLDQLLTMPNAHLIVDGYNVSKTGYADLSLEHQRTRLVSGVAALAARTGAEVTVVFDGREVGAGVRASLPPPPKRVRVLFSREGETADDVVRELAAAEPSGRPVIVVSSDREVVDGVRRSGAYTAPSALLVRRITVA